MWRHAARGGVLTGLLGLYLLALWNTAWLCDDAYISYRVCDNLVNGHGLRWNVIERVQAYTNPLWTLLNAVVYAITREDYYTWLAVSAAVSFAAVTVLLAGIARSVPAMLVAGAWLVLGRGFVTFSTSGLENPLTHLLLGVFMVCWLANAGPLWLALAASLAAINRLDTLVLFVPALAWRLCEGPWRDVARAYLRGSVPLAAWLVFATVYYGSAAPNTALAKMGGGIPPGERVARGWECLVALAPAEKLTLLGLAAGAVCMAASGARWRALLAGAVLYCGYFIVMGGDFLQARFFTPPFFVAIAGLAAYPAFQRWRVSVPVLALIVVIAYGEPRVTLVPDPAYEKRRHDAPSALPTNTRVRPWIAVGPPLVPEGVEPPGQPRARKMRAERAAGSGPRVREAGAIGMLGFYAGPEAHIIDVMGLADPVLARLPAIYDPGWVPGHLARRLPEGYAGSVLGAASGIEDPGLAQMDDLLRVVTRGPIWSRERWHALWALRGMPALSPELAEAYRFPGLWRVPLARAAQGEAGTPVEIGGGGLEVRLPGPSHAKRLRLTLATLTEIRLLFMSGAEVLGQADVAPPDPSRIEAFACEIPVPSAACDAGYTAVRFMPHIGMRRAVAPRLIALALDEMAED